MTRKVFDHETGEHVVAPPVLPADAVFDPPADPLSFVCFDCNAKPGEQCGSIIDASKPYPSMHASRRQQSFGGQPSATSASSCRRR